MRICTARHRSHTYSLHRRGTTLLDAVVGVALLLLVFLSVFGAFQLAIELVISTKAKTGALALANEQMEYVRSLGYEQVGTLGGIPAGDIAQEEAIILNNTEYTRRTLVQFVDAPEDGEGGSDENGITADYKRVKVEMTWDVRGEERSLALVTNVVPRGIETIAGGGTLFINVIDALGTSVEGASVRIVNSDTNPTIDVTTASNADGRVVFPGSPAAASYEIIVSKDGYSSAQTYDVTAGNPNPNPGHLTVLESQTTGATFAIDVLAQKTVRTFEPVQVEQFDDTFDDTSGIATSTDISVVGGDVVLVYGGGYVSRGELHSQPVAPAYISSWESFAWTDTTDADTSITYQLYYDTGSGEALVPDIVLPGNSTGFSSSPIDLSSISTTTYSSLMLGAILETTNSSTTPRLQSWTLTYQHGPLPIPNVPFTMRGNKTIGTDGSAAPIYKYEASLSTDGSGEVTIADLEWDTYTITIDDSATGYDVSESCLSQPRGIVPGEDAVTDITLVPDTAHTLLVSVVDDMGLAIANASVELRRTGFSDTDTASDCGQVFFGGLASSLATEAYTLDVSASSYETAVVSDIEVDGVTTITVTLVPSS